MSNEKKTTKTDGAAAKLRGLEGRIDKIELALERVFGIDLNKDGVIGGIKVALLLIISIVCIAGLAYGVEVLRVNGSGTSMVQYEQDSDGLPNGSMTIAGTMTASALAGDLTGAVTYTVTTADWTDGVTNTLVPGVYLVSGTGGANDTTNTVVLANPTTVGDSVTIVIAAASTNLITIADSGNVAASSAILLDFNDSVTLVAATTSLWVETAASDN